MRSALQEDMQDHAVSITTDAATLRNAKSYVTVTGHYVDQEWRYRECVLAVEALESRAHTAEYIGELLDDMSATWMRTNRFVAAVSDNGSNFVKAIRISKQFTNQLRCVVHTLQLSVKQAADSIPELQALMMKSKELITKIRRSTHLRGQLEKVQLDVVQLSTIDANALQELTESISAFSLEADPDAYIQSTENNTESESYSSTMSAAKSTTTIKKSGRNSTLHSSTSAATSTPDPVLTSKPRVYALVADVATRFNTICMMFSRLLEIKKSVHALCAAVSELRPLAISQEEWRLMEEFNKVLMLIKVVSDTLEGSKYPTISLLVPFVHYVSDVLIGQKDDPDLKRGDYADGSPTIKLMNSIWVDLKRRWTEQYQEDPIPHIAFLLDARVRTSTNLVDETVLTYCRAQLRNAFCCEFHIILLRIVYYYYALYDIIILLLFAMVNLNQRRGETSH